MDELSNARLLTRAAPLAACGCQACDPIAAKAPSLFGILSQLPDDLVLGSQALARIHSDRVTDPKSLRQRRLWSCGGLLSAKMGMLLPHKQPQCEGLNGASGFGRKHPSMIMILKSWFGWVSFPSAGRLPSKYCQPCGVPARKKNCTGVRTGTSRSPGRNGKPSIR